VVKRLDSIGYNTHPFIHPFIYCKNTQQTCTKNLKKKTVEKETAHE